MTAAPNTRKGNSPQGKNRKLLLIGIGILLLAALYLGFELMTSSGILAFAAADPTKCGPAPETYEAIEGFARDEHGNVVNIVRAIAGAGEGHQRESTESLVFPACTSADPALESVSDLHVEMLDPETLEPTGKRFHVVVGVIWRYNGPFGETGLTQ